MSKRRIELCKICGEPTGRAGRFDDSLYLDSDSGDGPYCESCFREANDPPDSHRETQEEKS